MKLFKRILVTVGCVFLALLFAALIFRIALADYYPREMTKLAYSNALSAYCAENGGMPPAYTQKIRVPVSSRPGKDGGVSTSDGSFFSSSPIWMPEAGNFQITVRYNGASLETVEAAYRAFGHPDVTLKTAAEGMFSYRLVASYYNEETEASFTHTAGPSLVNESSFMLYHYAKLVFDAVPAEVEGASLRWMRVDVRLAGFDEVFCNLAVYETYTVIDGVTVPVTVWDYVPGKDELPQ